MHARTHARTHAAGIASIAQAIGAAAVKAVVTMVGITIAGRTLLRPLYKRVAGESGSQAQLLLLLLLLCLRGTPPPPPFLPCPLPSSPLHCCHCGSGRRRRRHPCARPAETNNSEIFNALTLLVVLGTSLVTQVAGLSLALGAFLAGLLLAETEYHLQVGRGERGGREGRVRCCCTAAAITWIWSLFLLMASPEWLPARLFFHGTGCRWSLTSPPTRASSWACSS